MDAVKFEPTPTEPTVLEVRPETESVKMTVRMPRHLHDWLRLVGDHNGISMNQLISFLLIQVKDQTPFDTEGVTVETE